MSIRTYWKTIIHHGSNCRKITRLFYRVTLYKLCFSVRYKNDVFDSDAKEYFLHIRVLPPWYRGSWAMIAYGLVLATICLGIVYWLRRRIVEKQDEVARKIREEQKEKLYEAKLNFFANLI